MKTNIFFIARYAMQNFSPKKYYKYPTSNE